MRASVLFIALLVACDCGSDPACVVTADCPSGLVCVDSTCRAPDEVDGGRDARVDTDIDTGPTGTPCVDGACSDDERCTAADVCVPFGPGESDAACVRDGVVGPIRPQLQCEWVAPTTEPATRGVLHSPLVADFGVASGPDSPSRPSLVFVSNVAYREGVARVCESTGSVRLIDGATCAEISVATEVAVTGSATPALGDLDGDGFPEIVAVGADGGLVAFDVARPSGALSLLWRSTTSGGGADDWGSTLCLWGGVSLVDLDDDAVPEIFFEGAVWNAAGVRIAEVPGWIHAVGTGSFGELADIDADGRIELVSAAGIWEWDGAAFVTVATLGYSGYAGLADFGDFGAAMGDTPGQPEVAIVEAGRFRLVTANGTEVFSLASGGRTGGPPTIADYDGDGAPEIGAAFAEAYVVADPGTGTLLWSQLSQDASSARTGSSVFDFNGDGRAEVVYADECYLRVYDGPGGEVIFSQPRFSSTWTETPIVADVDGDSAAEVVVGASGGCNPGYCPEHDPIFRGLQCEVAEDCPGDGGCVAGLCRCTTNEQCGTDYDCTPPLGGVGEENVCRSFHRDCVAGLRVFRDARDRWAPSRGIWNQHAYHVTNIGDDGVVPQQSAVRPNWSEPGLNNLRQNVQGSLLDVPGPDLTVGALVAGCEGMNTRLGANVCNRGASFLDAGVTVIFRQAGGDELCRLLTADPIAPGECTPVSCVAPVQADGVFEAVVDPDAIISECIEGNNGASGEANCLL